ncbi:uncharacterized protein TNCV_978961 [Trichonephila clavipes]|nr:uncharacterized protein TNCV_978961 [Trichonephila clavipes]
MATNDVDTPAAFTYLWAIENCLALLAPEMIESPVFEVESLESTEWHLAIKEKGEKLLSISIHREQDSGPDIIEIVFQLSLLTSQGTCVKKEIHRSQFLKGGHFELAEPTDYIFKSTTDQYLSNDTLTLRCQMWGVGLDTPRANLCFAGSRLGLDRRTFFCSIRNFSTFAPGQELTAVAEWYRYRIVACLVTSSSPVPLKTRRVGQRCTLNLSRAETSSRWCGVVVRRGGCHLRCRPRHLTMVQNYVVLRQKPSCS